MKTNLRYIAFTSALGSALEYYSFVIYILLAAYFGKLFFPAASPHAALLNTLLVFAVGYIAAPLGAGVFSFIADRIGRKHTMVCALTLMAVATFAIGLLPTYQSAGMLATGLLVLLRFTQGLAQGAEIPGAITFMSEHAQDKHQAALCGLLFFAVGMGALLSTLVNYILTSILNEQEVLNYGWRIPFLFAGILGIIGYKIRTRVAETPLFSAQKPEELARFPLVTLFKTCGSKLIIGLGLVWSGATLVNFGLFLPTFLQTYFGYAARDTYLAMTLGFALDFLLIVFGVLADRIKVKRFYLIGVVIDLILIAPIFGLLQTKTLVALYGFNLLFHLLVLFLAAGYPTMLARLFPTKIRYSGIAFSYLIAYSVAGLIPFVTTWLYVNCCGLHGIVTFFVVSLGLSLGAGIFYQDKQLK